MPLNFKKPPDLDEAQYQEAKSLPNDLKHHPHAFVIGCVVDRWPIRADRAWLIPYRLSRRIGSFEFCTLLELSEDEFKNYTTQPTRLHPLEKVNEYVYLAIQLIAERYQGNAGAIWAGRPSSATLVYRFLEFKGIGQKVATMAANILVREFKVPVSDHFSIDISVDVHVRRVFQRLGLIPTRASNEQVIYRARELNPEFPGILDPPAWQIGREWCKPTNPRCSECFMEDLCPKLTG